MPAEQEYDIAIRASSLWELLDCNARWKSKYIDRLSKPTGSAGIIGTAVHFGTASFDTERLIAIPPSVDTAMQAAAEAIEKQREEVIWNDHTQAEAITIATTLVRNYCRKFAPAFDFDVVELQMEPLIVQARNGLRILFTGHIDRRRVAKDGVRKGIIDIKTGRAVISAAGEVNTQMSGAQMAVYELLELMASNTLGKFEPLPAMIFAMPTSGKHEPRGAEIHRPYRVLLGADGRKGIIDTVAEIIKNESWFGNARSKLCSQKYCPAYNNCVWRFQGDPQES